MKVSIKKLLVKVLTKVPERLLVRTLQSGDDLNNLTGASATGLYYIRTNVSNSPVTWATLLVIGDIGTSQIIFNANYIYVRMYTGTPLTWGAWRRFAPAS